MRRDSARAAGAVGCELLGCAALLASARSGCNLGSGAGLAWPHVSRPVSPFLIPIHAVNLELRSHLLLASTSEQSSPSSDIARLIVTSKVGSCLFMALIDILSDHVPLQHYCID